MQIRSPRCKMATVVEVPRDTVWAHQVIMLPAIRAQKGDMANHGRMHATAYELHPIGLTPPFL